MAHKHVLYTGQPQHFARLGVTLQPGENYVEEAPLAVLLANPAVKEDLVVLGDAPATVPDPNEQPAAPPAESPAPAAPEEA